VRVMLQTASIICGYALWSLSGFVISLMGGYGTSGLGTHISETSSVLRSHLFVSMTSPSRLLSVRQIENAGQAISIAGDITTDVE